MYGAAWFRLNVLFYMKRLATVLRRKTLAIVLWLLFLASTFFMFKASRDPMPLLLRETVIESWFSQLSTGNQITFNQITFNLAGGIISGLFIYVLVVWLPEQCKRRRVRDSLAQHYDLFKEECISIFLSALQQSHDPELLQRLKYRSYFRQYFKEKIAPDQERWHSVINGLNGQLVKQLFVELEILMNEVRYALTVIDIENEDAFTFLKRVSQVLYRYRNVSDTYDDMRQLYSFMWVVHTGWSVIDGYTDKDVIADIIEAI
ncbi:MAG: hypothetical protein PF630_12455 [Gammaproteobacteria bacterium]|jgi:hypothetical protein|nr:hypothetical protein [Gammaproteobacteria bacterium]